MLCLGSDGHVAIEAPGTRGCGSGSLEPAAAVTESPLEEWTAGGVSHCGVCIDVPLVQSLAAGIPLSSAPESQASPACVSSHTTALSPKQLASKTLDRAHGSPFLSIKPYTVVLRC